MKKQNDNQTKNLECIPGVIETIPADEAEELGAFMEHALSEEDALEAIEKPGVIETIPADEAEELGAFVEDALSEEDALEATEKKEKSMSQLFKAAFEESKEEIDGFFIEDNPHTHYILFLEYLKLLNILATEQQIDLKGEKMNEMTEQQIDLEDEKMRKITEYLYDIMPHRDILANVMTPEYFPDLSVMMDLMLLPPEDLATKKSNLKDGLEQWYI